jgi:outer membrane protein OmpA-like peptidoglycan-associated protein
MHRLFLLAAVVVLASCSHEADQPLPVYIVFFHKGSVEVAPESRPILTEAAAAIRRMRPGAVAIASGVAEGDNLKLAGPRFNAIREALVAQGVGAELIARAALPDAKLNVGPNGDQRAEILLAKPPS